ncbi:MAG: hypothetical protein D4R74_08460 [Betaproteobacteria bacterium]|nr:MAG: hypothetical protein D4R74_08460 [Betaproteobacteria bacterium]
MSKDGNGEGLKPFASARRNLHIPRSEEFVVRPPDASAPGHGRLTGRFERDTLGYDSANA